MVRDRLATATNLIKRNIPLPSVLCRLYGQIEGDVTHIFIGCEYAVMIWGIVSQWCKLQPIFAFDLKDLLEISCYIKDKKKAKMVYVVILAACWAILKERNDAAFNNKKPSIHHMITEIKTSSYMWVRHRLKMNCIDWDVWSSFAL